MSALVANILIVMALGALGLYVSHRSKVRAASEVLLDLKAFEDGDVRELGTRERKTLKKFSLEDPLTACGLFSEAERAKVRRAEWLIPIGVGLFTLLVRMVFSQGNIPGNIVSVILAVALSYLYLRRRLETRKREFMKAIEFYLPVVMERLVMGAQAGLDILPAIQSIIDDSRRFSEDEEAEDAQSESTLDPVSRLLVYAYKLTEAGLPFSDALEYVAEKIESSPLRHAFIHLGVAHKEGGEIVAPLRELSDSTQLYFQESIEEEIAKMPVKATAPLLCTFAGLLIFFLASPLVQIISFIAKAKPGGM